MVLGFAVGTYEAVRMAFLDFLDLIQLARKQDVSTTRSLVSHGDSHY